MTVRSTMTVEPDEMERRLATDSEAMERRFVAPYGRQRIAWALEAHDA